ncbi:50S ribosomal protein L13-like protein [Tanacetum coccineum]
MNKPGHRAWYEQHNSSQHFTFRSKLSVNAQMTWRMLPDECMRVIRADDVLCQVRAKYKEGSISRDATKESINEDKPLSEMVINVEYPSAHATKEQPQDQIRNHEFPTWRVTALSKVLNEGQERHVNGESMGTSDNMLPKVVMEGSISNATKESINEDKPLSEMVINVEYPSAHATKEQPQVALFAICIQGLGKKKHRKGRKQRKISTLCELVPAPTPAPSSTPASIDRPVSSTRLPEPSEDAMPYGRMRYVGRVKERSLKDKMAKDPIEVIRKAVLRMLPRNKLRDDRYHKLRIFLDSEHVFGDKPLEPYLMPPC